MQPKKIILFAGVFVITVLFLKVALPRNEPPSLEQVNEKTLKKLNSSKFTGNKLRLPAPPIQPGSGLQSQNENPRAAELYDQFHVPKLSFEQAEKFLAENNRSALSLVAAYRTSGDEQYLVEAMKAFPNDPHVAFEAFFRPNLPPEERRKWADALMGAAPDNSLGNYLSAHEYFKSGQTDLAVGELEAASLKPRFNDLTLERMLANEEAYRANGFSEAESRTVSMFQLPLPLLNEVKGLAGNINELSKSYGQTGDTASRDAAIAITINLGEQYRNSGNALLVHQLLGIGIEQSALKTLDQGAPFGRDGRTAGDLLNDLNSDRAGLLNLVQETVHLQDRMTPQDWIAYIDRMKTLGEPNAMRWLKTKYGPR